MPDTMIPLPRLVRFGQAALLLIHQPTIFRYKAEIKVDRQLSNQMSEVSLTQPVTNLQTLQTFGDYILSRKIQSLNFYCVILWLSKVSVLPNSQEELKHIPKGSMYIACLCIFTTTCSLILMEHAAYGKNICQQKPSCSSKFGMSQNQERLKIPLHV